MRCLILLLSLWFVSNVHASSITARNDTPSPDLAEPGKNTGQDSFSPSNVLADIFNESDHVYFQTSLLSKHFNPKPEHNNTQKLIDMQWHWKSQYLVGLSFFKNSFNQPTQFAYFGRQWDIPHTSELLYFTLVGGMLHGYKGEHKEDIPFNDHGIAPAALPILGFRYAQIHSQVIFFGTAGFTWTLGFELPVN